MTKPITDSRLAELDACWQQVPLVAGILVQEDGLALRERLRVAELDRDVWQTESNLLKRRLALAEAVVEVARKYLDGNGDDYELIDALRAWFV